MEVVVQMDLPGGDGMTRVRFGPRGRETSVLAGHEGSSSPGELAALLDWVAENTDARRVMLAIAGHAGHLEELAPDDDASGRRRWMTIDELAPVLDGFRARLHGDVELLFLQSCAKAAVEVAYELRAAARFLLASQAPLGAPNHYYRGALAALRAVPSTDGAGLAEVIAASEQPDMFVGLSLVDLASLGALPALVDAAAAESSAPIDARALDDLVFLSGGDAFVDAQALLQARRARAAVPPRGLDALADFLGREALVWHRTSPTPAPGATLELPDEGPPTGLWIRLAVEGTSPASSRFALVRDTRLLDLASAAE